MINISLPIPPSANALFRNVPGKGRVRTERYRTWAAAAGWEIKEQRPGAIAGHYVLTLTCQRPDKRRRDIGNLVKSVEDLLVTHGLVTDDSLCAEIHVRWEGIGRRCFVTLEPLSATKQTEEARDAA